jgi:hypothetical protein
MHKNIIAGRCVCLVGSHRAESAVYYYARRLHILYGRADLVDIAISFVKSKITNLDANTVREYLKPSIARIEKIKTVHFSDKDEIQPIPGRSSTGATRPSTPDL